MRRNFLLCLRILLIKGEHKEELPFMYKETKGNLYLAFNCTRAGKKDSTKGKILRQKRLSFFLTSKSSPQLFLNNTLLLYKKYKYTFVAVAFIYIIALLLK